MWTSRLSTFSKAALAALFLSSPAMAQAPQPTYPLPLLQNPAGTVDAVNQLITAINPLLLSGQFNGIQPGTQNGAVLYDNNGRINGLQVNTVGGIGGTVQPLFSAANIRYQISQALEIDPRYYGANCQAQYYDGRNGTNTVNVTNHSADITIPGHTFNPLNVSIGGDVGKYIALNCGALGDAGMPLSTIIAVSPDGLTATMADTVNTAGGENTCFGYALISTDDTAAINNASVQTAAFHGSKIVLPPNCAVRDLHLANFTMLEGNALGRGYGYGNDNRTPLYILATGYSEDTGGAYGIEPTGTGTNDGIVLKDLTVKGLAFPFFAQTAKWQNGMLSCIGSDKGNSGSVDGLVLDGVTVQNCYVGLGTALGHTATGYLFGHSRHSEFVDNGFGTYGPFSDWVFEDDVFTGNFQDNMHLGPKMSAPSSATSVSLIRVRAEEGGQGIVCDGCLGLHAEGSEIQFTGQPGLVMQGDWSQLTWTGGFIQANGQQETGTFVGSISGNTLTVTSVASNTIMALYEQITGAGVTAGTYITGIGANTSNGVGTYTLNNSMTVGSETMNKDAYTDILLVGSSAHGGLSIENTQFPSVSTSIPHTLLYAPSATAATDNPNINIQGGYIKCSSSNKSYSVALDLWLNSTRPSEFILDTPDCARFDSSHTTGSINSSGGFGIGTTTPNAGASIDMGSRTDSAILPQGTTGQEPSPSALGMLRWNTTIGSMEIFNGTVWAPVFAAGSNYSFQPGLLSAATTGYTSFYQVPVGSTLASITGSAQTFTCASNPVLTLSECGTSTTCASPTILGQLTLSAANTATPGIVSNFPITAGDYIAFQIASGTCTALDPAVTAITNPGTTPYCSYAFPLDTYTAAAAYSFRLLSTAYSGGNIATIKRSSDSTTKTFTATTGACGINQFDSFFDGSNYTLETWYDQSGNGANLTMTGHPVFKLNCQNTEPCVVFDGATQYGAATIASTSVASYATVVNLASVASGAIIDNIGTTFDNATTLSFTTSSNKFRQQRAVGFTTGNGTINATANAWVDLIGITSNTLSSVYLNGTKGSDDTSSLTLVGATNLNVGSDNSHGNKWNGSMAEDIVLPSTLAPSDVAVIHSNQAAYWGTP